MSAFGSKRQPRKITVQDEEEEDGGAPLRVRPFLGSRSSSSKPKKKPSSRLSFGLGEGASIEDSTAALGGELPIFTPKKTSLAAAVVGNSAYKKGLKGVAKNNILPVRSSETDEDRPRYSKEYLSELQNSTPSTPARGSSLQIADDDGDIEMVLDPSELEGATVVEVTSNALSVEPATTPHILTESEIAEKKARRERQRERLAAQSDDFIPLDASDDDSRQVGDSYLTLLSRSSKSKPKEKRLTTDDDLVEDDSFFVEDGGLSLGKKAERDAARKKRADMANMIAAAEGNSDGETSDDSEAERRAAYEKAQTRAGMDGLAEEREAQQRRLNKNGGVQVPPKITPLPDLSVLVEEFKARMGRKEVEAQRMKDKIAQLKREREGIMKREPEVQTLLNEAGERYQSLMGQDSVAAAKSLLDRARGGDTAIGAARGLDSLGTTPIGQDRMEM
ncbi:nineteen complex-related protein 2-domain-containing protein [Pseudomassariella vexata]|uniref:Nineteen complex-related protein 2-domain-containing protein n=1 Tax=Pseudomassariella vexata TaxID=1141098 RepID=A0A1Y2DGR4_9PEZI|nr:nineteen complex-related protein 2-domain-containing protein [Pseudomassariella vexata]ORY57885.1 nineteen complex-related protein 2-domain-containing protein [Pseudomassariella vexata]